MQMRDLIGSQSGCYMLLLLLFWMEKSSRFESRADPSLKLDLQITRLAVWLKGFVGMEKSLVRIGRPANRVALLQLSLA